MSHLCNQTYGYLAVVHFAKTTTVLPLDSYRITILLWEASLIYLYCLIALITYMDQDITLNLGTYLSIFPW